MRLQVDTITLLDSVERHRARLFDSLERLTPAEWRASSRCEDWSVADVVGHLRWGTESGLELLRRVDQGCGERVFDGFDPRTTPEAGLEPLRGHDPAENLAALRAGTATLLAAARDLAVRGVEEEADTPLGWVPWPLAVNHLLWDSWLHERDILVPLGGATGPDPGEVRLVGSYQLVPLGAVLARAGVRCRIDLRLEGAGGGAYRLSLGDELVVDHPQEPPGDEGCL
ncbi:MAG: maleylpyruvate isomerase family mycothiol-dependent enzyme, partial [Candidatus Dormibacteria bacterium]